jgi:hypothetical protein
MGETMMSKHLRLLMLSTLVAIPLTGCALKDAATDASVGEAIDNYYFPEGAAKDSSTELDTVPNASEVKELND